MVNYKHDKFLLLFDKLFIEQNKIDKLKDLIRKKSIIIKSRYLKKNKYLNIHNFKKFLYEIGYSWIESDALYYETPAHFSVKSFHKITKHNFKFNFENFDKTIKNKIFCSNKKTFYFEELVDIYLKSYVENSKNKKKNKIKTIVFKSPNELTTIENCANEILSCKIIYVKRDCLGLLKSRALDLKIREKGKDINIYFQRVLFSKYLDNIKFSYQKINQLQKKFPKKLFITSLEKIIFNRFEEVTNILKFLRLKKKQIYFKPSFNNFLYIASSVSPSQPNNKILDFEFKSNLFRYSLFLYRPINAIIPGTAHSPAIIFSLDNWALANIATTVDISSSDIVKL